MSWNWIRQYGWIAAIVLLLGTRYLYFKPLFVAGAEAPDFEMVLADRQELRLSQLRGQFVLLDFWGSWCGPCRKENPELVTLYQELKKQTAGSSTGFEIISLGIETDSSAWLRAIRNDGLVWPYHSASMERFHAPVAELYGVRQIPTKYLINPEGRIMAVNPTVAEVLELVSARIN